MGSRLVYGMAGQGLLPARLATIHPSRRTPHYAIALLTLIVLVLVAFGDISSLARATSVLLLFVFVVVNSALLVLQRRPQEPKGVLDVPAIVPVLGIVVNVALVWSAQRAELLIAGGLVAGTIVTYFIVRPRAATVE
jgi:basic amino acid/polyamine antiporter, APA family